MVIYLVYLGGIISFRKILSIFFPITKVKEIWHSLAGSYIDVFFMELKKIDKDSLFEGLEDENNKLMSIKKYCRNIEIELEKEEYKNVGVDTEKIFMNINHIFEVCQFWNEVEDIINQKKDRKTAEFEQYFDMFGYSVKENIFSNIGNLLQALAALKKYYEEKKDCYESDYSLFLQRLSCEIVLKYESESEWFEDKGEEVSVILTEISEMVNVLDKVSDRYAEDRIDLINIYVYRFKAYCEQDK